MIDLIFWILSLALFAEILGTMAGFGSSTIFLPIMLLFFDSKTTLVLFLYTICQEISEELAFSDMVLINGYY